MGITGSETHSGPFVPGHRRGSPKQPGLGVPGNADVNRPRDGPLWVLSSEG